MRPSAGKRPPPFTNLAVFALFFGLALFETVAERDWIEASFFALLGVISLRADFHALRGKR